MSNTLGIKLVKLLKNIKMTQKDFANKLDVTESALSRYIKGDREPRMELLIKMANELGTTVDYLLDNENNDDSFPQIESLIARNASNLTPEQKQKLLKILINI
ncbi:MAG: helix-turn-helix transcriptional regulator [Succinatimonas sp.]|nr:helix-turn-helix transcriptional regulator [Succinatimonas sp.]